MLGFRRAHPAPLPRRRPSPNGHRGMDVPVGELVDELGPDVTVGEVRRLERHRRRGGLGGGLGRRQRGRHGPVHGPVIDAWDWDAEEPLGAPRRWRLAILVVLAGFVAVVGWVATHGPGPGLVSLSTHGYVTLMLAAVLAGVVLIHYAGGARHLARVLVEFTIVALLAVLLATPAADGGGGTAAAPPSRHAATAPATTRAAPATPGSGHSHGPAGGGANQPQQQPSASLVDRVRAWVTGLWHRADQAAGRALPSPLPSTSASASPPTKAKAKGGDSR
jgi:hypothetical protein